jgi:glucose dehydrogenase
MSRGTIKWQIPLGDTPLFHRNIGVPGLGGRQYVVIAAGGYKGDSTRGDYVVAYALPP